MREPLKWKEADLLSLVTNQAQEGPELDFKECAALEKTDGKKRELAKDVSAFANSAGGTLVYGIVEDPNTHTAASLDAGYDPAELSHEWLDQVINSKIQPRITGVRINTVPLSTSAPGRVAYVVCVPQASTAHQAADKRYYKRFNFESVPMEHYEIMDVMNRSGAPDVRIEVVIHDRADGTCNLGADGIQERSPEFEIYAVNDEMANVADYSWHRVFLCDRTAVVVQGKSHKEKANLRRSATRASVQDGHLSYGFMEFRLKPDEPLFPGERRFLATFQLDFPQDWTGHGDVPLPFLLWQTRASRMPRPTVGAVRFERIEQHTVVFGPAALAELEKAGFTVEFAP